MNQITHPVSLSKASFDVRSLQPSRARSKSSRDTWPRALLWIAAGWNIIGGVSALLDPARHFAQMYSATLALDQPLQLFFFRCVWINVIAWGVAYLIASFMPASRSAVLIAGGAGKLVYFVASVALFISGVGNGMVLTAGLVDLAFTAMFVVVVRASWAKTQKNARELREWTRISEES